MPRVLGIDPGTLSIDVCGLAGGRVYLDASWPTADALADPDSFLARLTAPGVPDLVVGPSGYGLPLQQARDASERDLRLAFLAAPEEPGGIGGLRGLVRRLAAARLPMVYVPGVVHLDTVPEHRKLNRVDLGTADKVCAAALAIREVQERTGRPTAAVSLILLELGGAFTAGVAVRDGEIVDGIGGSSGPIGWRAAGALDGEVAFLAGEVRKDTLFQGGVETVVGRASGLRRVATDAFIEGAHKAVRQLMVSVPEPDELLLSGRHAEDRAIVERLARELADVGPVRRLEGFAARAKQGAQGAAVLADGLAGGEYAPVVDRLRIREARGTVLDHLYVITPEQAARRLGLERDA
jgi:predicted butyrate kinase (DUF1464 family)